MTADREAEPGLLDRLAALTVGDEGCLAEIHATCAAVSRFHVPAEYLVPGSRG